MIEYPPKPGLDGAAAIKELVAQGERSMVTRSWKLASGALLLAAATSAIAQSPKNGDAVRQALASRDYRAATIAFNEMVTQRLPAAAKAGGDPVLDQLLAELVSVTGAPASAISLLQRVVSASTATERGHYQLLLAVAHEDGGQFDEAEKLYQAIGDDAAATSDDRLGGVLGFVRLHMMKEPDQAMAVLTRVRPNPSQAWEVELYRARIEALAGRDDAARAALQAAWSAAPAAGPGQGAAARVSSDMMVAAGRAGDRARMIALLSVDRLNRYINTGQSELSAGLPVCGTDGILPEDSVALEFLRQAPPGRSRFALVWASRPGAASPFLRALARSGGFDVPDGHAAAVMLRCRQAPAADYQGKLDLDDQLLSWSTSRGAYPLLDPGDAPDASTFATVLAERERRYGPTSVMLLPVLVRIFEPTASNAVDQEARARAAALARRIADIVAANKGPADIVLLSALSASGLEVAAQVKSMSAAQTEFATLLAAAARNPDVSPDTLYAVVNGAAAASQVPTALRVQLLEQTIGVLRNRGLTTDPRTSALGMRLIGVRREQGDEPAVTDVVRQFGFAPDLCIVASTPVRLVSSNITPDDYPSDLVQSLLQGRTVLEFTIGASGIALGTRLLVSDPPFAFDVVALTKSSTLTYEPAKTNSTPRACRAQTQPIRWQLPS